MSQHDLKELLNHKFKLFVYATGAGAGIQKDLWSVPGCSSFLVGAEFTYDSVETIRAIGHEPESFCSKKTSIELAMAAYMRAYNVNDVTDNFVGLGLTASVASSKAHRGEHRVFATVISDKNCITISALLKKGEGVEQRIIDGNISDEIAKSLLFAALGVPPVFSKDISSYEVAYPSDEELVSLIMERPYFRANGLRTGFEREWIQSRNLPRPLIIYPGTFNPYHLGHKGCADSAEAKLIYDKKEKPQLVYATCINPAHKPPPTAVDLLKKASQMKGNNFLLTKDDALYVEKARIYSDSIFVMGADALITLLSPKWTKDPQALFQEFRKYNTTFYVAGRVVNDKFTTLNDLYELYPNVLPCSIFNPLDGRWDISSTELRNQK
jgi:nicotinic acid mononucleotide adenylyltransferase